MLAPFTWGKGGVALTPEQIAQRRALAEAAREGSTDTSPVAHWTQGAARVVGALSGIVQDRRADKAEAEGLASADEYIANDPVLSALIGGRAAPAMSSGGVAPVAGPVAGPNQDIANEAMAAIGSHDHSVHSGQSHADWLRYSNQNATRNKPLDDRLVQALSFLPEMGITMNVVSGGQDAQGQGDRRTGSTRHDHGGAADADFYIGDRKLDWNNPDDLPIFAEIVRRARANGVTGIGAGDNYMGAGRMHIGFGPEAVWGAGGSGETAPEWLRAAYNGAPVGGGMSASGQPVPITGGGGDVVGALASAMSNPWVAQKYGPVINALMDQQMKRGDMQYQQQLAQADPMYQAQLNELLNPRQEMPASVQETQWRAQQLGLTPGTPEYQEFIRGSSGSAAPASFEALRLQALEAGLQPGTPEYQNFMLNGGGDPATFRALDMQARRAGFEPGTPEYQDFMATRGSGQQAFARTSGENAANIATGGQAAGAVAAGRIEGENTANAAANLSSNLAQADQAIGLINSIMEDPALPGITGMIQGRLPPMTQGGTDLNVKIKQLQGKAFLEAFESLKGGGAITEREGQAATEAMARLDRAQSTEEYIAALTELRDIMQTGADRARAGAGAPPPNDDGWTVINGVRVREKR